MQLLIYGATGFTGRLIVQEALKQGLRPIVAGRNQKLVEDLAKRLGLEARVFSLEGPQPEVVRALEGVGVVVHAAGPFVFTSKPMVDACLKAGIHYVDITGELPVFDAIYARDAEAKAANVALVPGGGYDIVPTDCLALFATQQVDAPVELRIAIHGNTDPTSGTMKSMLEQMANPEVRVTVDQGVRKPCPLGSDVRTFTFGKRSLSTLHAPLADLAAAPRTTGVSTVGTYLSMPPRAIAAARRWGWLGQRLLRVGFIKSYARQWAENKFRGPSVVQQSDSRSYATVQVTNQAGKSRSYGLTLPEPYALTAMTSVGLALRLLDSSHPRPAGALTPAQLMGADFILTLPNTERYEIQ
jgi:short subunit dehydrogenase-like uncharacterized protein